MHPRLNRWLSTTAYGLFTSAFFRANSKPERMRARFERFARLERSKLAHRHPNVRFEDHEYNGVSIESISAVDDPACAFLYLHGGAFFMGSPGSYRRRTMKLSFRCDAELFVPAYRLAPEHPFPAALNDAIAAYDYLRRVRPDRPILLAGDSAGGGLAISLLIAIRDSGRPAPNGAITFSPWTDHTCSSDSVDANAAREKWLTRKHLEQWSHYVVGNHDPGDPLLSPAFASLHDLPPTLVIAGEHEALLDDARRVADGMNAAGGRATLHIGAAMQHDFPLTLPWLTASRLAWDELVSFANQRCVDHPAVESRVVQ